MVVLIATAPAAPYHFQCYNVGGIISRLLENILFEMEVSYAALFIGSDRIIDPK